MEKMIVAMRMDLKNSEILFSKDIFESVSIGFNCNEGEF